MYISESHVLFAYGTELALETVMADAIVAMFFYLARLVSTFLTYAINIRVTKDLLCPAITTSTELLCFVFVKKPVLQSTTTYFN